MILWIENSEVEAVVVVTYIYTRADLEGTSNTNTKGKREESSINKNNHKCLINNGCEINDASLLILRYTLDYKQEQVKLYL